MFLLIKIYTCCVNKEVGDTIRELRKEKHLSQEKLADAIDSHQVYISEIEKGIKLPSLNIINNIAKAFDVSSKTIHRNRLKVYNTTKRETTDIISAVSFLFCMLVYQF